MVNFFLGIIISLFKITVDYFGPKSPQKRIETNSTKNMDMPTKVDYRLERIAERLEDSIGATALNQHRVKVSCLLG